ncbi:hypothetical protein AVEN_27293-1 [Araneus ventricosus]|uniref:Uncharacterized protein n=1 Tax=Araneus ventricosus TaxID=182803 RepID=A0A4Y2VYZ2_ARAVE|nr:hypothetical protein AVEN_27293-1 [Araneus ventricosus]
MKATVREMLIESVEDLIDRISVAAGEHQDTAVIFQTLSGNVKGSYGYRDTQGLYRLNDYSAGPAGFTATINTNESGVGGKETTAEVIMNVEKTLVGIQERWTRLAGSGFGDRGKYLSSFPKFSSFLEFLETIL